MKGKGVLMSGIDERHGGKRYGFRVAGVLCVLVGLGFMAAGSVRVAFFRYFRVFERILERVFRGHTPPAIRLSAFRA